MIYDFKFFWISYWFAKSNLYSFGFMVQSVFKEDLYFQKSQTFKMCAYCFDFSIQLLMRRRSLEGVV